MSPTLRNLLFDPLLYPFLVVFVGALLALVRYFTKNLIAHGFAAQLESHKHDLQLLADHVRFQQQMDLAGASLYLQKQHVAAAEIYRAFRIAHGHIARLFGVRPAYDLVDYNESDLRELMTNSHVLAGKQDEILALWRIDREKGGAVLLTHLAELTLPLAELKFDEARNLIYENEIYFSNDANTAIDQFVAICATWIAQARFGRALGARSTHPSRKELDGGLARLQEVLRAEISSPSQSVGKAVARRPAQP